MNLETAACYHKSMQELYVTHANYEYVRKRLHTLTHFHSANRVIMLVGPPRVGKGAVWDDVSSLLVPKPELIPADAQPVVTIEAANTVGGLFSQKHLVMRTLSEIRHPILGNFGNIDGTNAYDKQLRLGEPDMRLALEKGLTFRRTQWLAIDEAHHCLYARGKDLDANILDSLKCLGNVTPLVLIVIGSFKLLQGGLKSAHFAGRVIVVPFMHYKYSSRETRDTRKFGEILDLLDKVLPVPTPHYLLDNQDYMHKGCIGNYGLLITWIENALSLMVLKPKVRHLSRSIFDDALMLCVQREQILEDIRIGVALLKKYRIKMPEYEDTEKAPPLRKKPFARKLGRDPVGMAPK